MNLRNLVKLIFFTPFVYKERVRSQKISLYVFACPPLYKRARVLQSNFSQCVCKLYVYKISKKISSLFDKKTNSSSKPSKKKEINIPKSAAPMLLLDIKKPEKSMKKKKKVVSILYR